MFYDPVHGRYHVFVQWTQSVPQAGKLSWYHFTSKDLAHWERLGVDQTHNVSGCSGGAVMAPDGTPTLTICGGSTAQPLNRSDPLLRQWVEMNSYLTSDAYFPEEVPGKWDCSTDIEPASGRYRLTFGSCAMLGNRTRAHLGHRLGRLGVTQLVEPRHIPAVVHRLVHALEREPRPFRARLQPREQQHAPLLLCERGPRLGARGLERRQRGLEFELEIPRAPPQVDEQVGVRRVRHRRGNARHAVALEAETREHSGR